MAATKEAGEPNHSGDLGGASVWYRWTAPADGTLVLRIDDSFALNALVAVYTGASIDALSLVADESRVRPFVLLVRVTEETSYSIAIDGAFAPLTGPKTQSFVLSWEFFVPPPNDSFAAAQELTERSGSFLGSNQGATSEPGEPDPNGFSGGASVWYRWIAPETELVRLDTYEPDPFTSILDVYTGSAVDDLQPVSNVFDATWGHGKLTFGATEGTEYRIVVDGSHSQIGQFTLRWKPAGPPNDDFRDAETLEGPSASKTISNEWATKETGEPDHAGDPGGASVWYEWTPPWLGTATISTDNAIATALAVYTGQSLDDLSEVAHDYSPGGHATLELPVDGTRLWIAIDGGAGATGNIDFDLVFHPRYDDFADAEAISQAFGSGWSGIVGASSEPGEPAHAGVSAERSIWWRWTAPATGNAAFYAWAGPGSRFAAYSGASLDSLVPLGSDSVADGVATSHLEGGYLEIRFPAVEGNAYLLAVDGTAYLVGQVAIAREMLPNEPVPRIEVGSGLSTNSVPVALRWDGPSGSGIDHFDLEQRENADWASIGSVTTTSTVRALELAPAYKFRVRATSSEGQSDWVSSDEFAVKGLQESNPKIVYKGEWKRTTATSAFGGGLRYTRERDASARITATGRTLAIVAARGSARGKAAVLVDGKRVKTIDLYAARFQPRVVVFARNWAAPGRHSVELRALGTKNTLSSSTRVDLDAFLALG